MTQVSFKMQTSIKSIRLLLKTQTVVIPIEKLSSGRETQVDELTSLWTIESQFARTLLKSLAHVCARVTLLWGNEVNSIRP